MIIDYEKYKGQSRIALFVCLSIGLLEPAAYFMIIYSAS